MKLNITLLNIIIVVQSCKIFELSRGLLNGYKTDWYKNTEDYFLEIDRELADKAGIKLNHNTFEKILSYVIPDTAEEVEYSELGQFTF